MNYWYHHPEDYEELYWRLFHVPHPRQWGNLEGCLSGAILTRHLWQEVDRVTVAYINRPENRKLICDAIFGKSL